MNYIHSLGKLTITCFVHPDYTESGKRYHGDTTVAILHDVHFSDIQDILDREIEAYLNRCKFKHCDRTFSFKYVTY